jgi:hypothetical protein
VVSFCPHGIDMYSHFLVFFILRNLGLVLGHGGSLESINRALGNAYWKAQGLCCSYLFLSSIVTPPTAHWFFGIS